MRQLALLPMLAIALWGQTSLLPVVKGPLRVTGNQLIDATGSPFTLRGTAVPEGLPLAYAGTLMPPGSSDRPLDSTPASAA